MRWDKRWCSEAGGAQPGQPIQKTSWWQRSWGLSDCDVFSRGNGKVKPQILKGGNKDLRQDIWQALHQFISTPQGLENPKNHRWFCCPVFDWCQPHSLRRKSVMPKQGHRRTCLNISSCMSLRIACSIQHSAANKSSKQTPTANNHKKKVQWLMAGHCIILVSDLHSWKTNQKLLRETALTRLWKCLGSWQVQMTQTRKAACLQSSSCSTSFGGGRSGCNVTGSRLDTTSRGSKQGDVPTACDFLRSLRKSNVSWMSTLCASLCVFPARLSSWRQHESLLARPKSSMEMARWRPEQWHKPPVAFRACRLSIVAVQIVQSVYINYVTMNLLHQDGSFFVSSVRVSTQSNVLAVGQVILRSHDSSWHVNEHQLCLGSFRNRDWEWAVLWP